MSPNFYDSNANIHNVSPQDKISRCPHDKENPYAQISRELLRNTQLSFRARGLLCYMLSFPNNWVAHPKFIAKENGIGKDQLYSILKELIEAGYCKYTQQKDGNKFASCWYQFSEFPKFKKSLPCPGFTDTELSDPENPDLKETVKENDKNDVYKKNVNVRNRSSDTCDSIVSFDPQTYLLPNGQNLSIQMQRAIAKYSPDDMLKLRANIFYFEEQIAKGTKMDNPESYLQNCIKNNYAKGVSNAFQNELYAKFAKENYKLHKLEILKTVVRYPKSEREPLYTIKLSLPYESFVSILDRYIEENKE